MTTNWVDRVGQPYGVALLSESFCWAPGIGSAGVGVGSLLDHRLEPAEDRALKLVAVIVQVFGSLLSSGSGRAPLYKCVYSNIQIRRIGVAHDHQLARASLARL